MNIPLCLRCAWLEQEETEAHFEKNEYGYSVFRPNVIDWFCHAYPRYVRKVPKRCPKFLSLTQTKMSIGVNGMVKVDDIPSEGARLDLANLPQEMVLIATQEKVQEAIAGKTGGLVITYKLDDGRTFNQKYSKVSGAELSAACKRLKIKDTLDLQKAWYKYRLTNMRIGFPRMIPIEKVKEA